jgi:hypothetical protein
MNYEVTSDEYCLIPNDLELGSGLDFGHPDQGTEVEKVE